MHFEAPLNIVIGLGIDLQQAVLDAVMHHFNEMPRRARSHIGDARLAIHLGRDSLKCLFDAVIEIPPSARHDARSMTSPFLAAAYSNAHESDALRRQLAFAAITVCEMRIASVNDEVVFF